MPCYIGAWIGTKEKGIRLRLVPDEISKGLGVSKEERTVLIASIQRSTTNLFHWEYLSSSLIMLPSSSNFGTKAT
jgi:hypothetical protein